MGTVIHKYGNGVYLLYLICISVKTAVATEHFIYKTKYEIQRWEFGLVEHVRMLRLCVYSQNGSHSIPVFDRLYFSKHRTQTLY